MSIRTVNLVKNHIRNGMILVLILISFSNINAQFNSEIGYTIANLPAKLSNTIIDKYNSNLLKNDNLLTEMKPFHYVSGFDAGLTYRFNTVKFGAYWESLNAKRIGTEGNLSGAIEKQLYFSFNALSIGTEIQYEHIGLGGTLDYNMSSIKTKVSGTSSKINIISEKYFSNKLYLILYFRVTDKFGIALKPYVRLPWKDIDVNPMAGFLGVNTNAAFKLENFIQYGISMNIINGRQPDM